MHLEQSQKDSGRLKNKRTSREHQDYCIIKIGHNTKMRPGDLRMLNFSQNPVRNNQLTLVGKTPKEDTTTTTTTTNNNNNNNNNNNYYYNNNNNNGL